MFQWPPTNEKGQPMVHVLSATGDVDHDRRFGWIGDMGSGTLTCNFPECGAEIFTQTWMIDAAADAHWGVHAQAWVDAKREQIRSGMGKRMGL